MADVYEFCIRIDRDEEIAPQIIYWRARRVPWKILETLSGKRKARLEEAVARYLRRAVNASQR